MSRFDRVVLHRDFIHEWIVGLGHSCVLEKKLRCVSTTSQALLSIHKRNTVRLFSHPSIARDLRLNI